MPPTSPGVKRSSSAVEPRARIVEPHPFRMIDRHPDVCTPYSVLCAGTEHNMGERRDSVLSNHSHGILEITLSTCVVAHVHLQASSGNQDSPSAQVIAASRIAWHRSLVSQAMHTHNQHLACTSNPYPVPLMNIQSTPDIGMDHS